MTSAARDAADLQGTYRLLRPLGQGGMGEVFEVERIRDGCRFALKRFRMEKGSVAFLRERFRTEGRLLAKLSHPNLVPCVETGFWGDEPCYVMPLVVSQTGAVETLETVRKQEQTTPARIERWYGEVVDVLQYCHRMGVVHRDVKLENVLVDAEGRAVLADFGVAKICGGDLRETLQTDTTFLTGVTTGTRPVMGSYWYLAPEIRKGEPATAAADWYALGVLFFRLLTGLWYEPAAKAFDLLLPHDPVWRERLERLLSSDPARRTPGSVPSSGSVPPPGSVPSSGPVPSRRRLLLGGLSLFVLALGLGAGWFGLKRPADPVRRSVVRLPLGGGQTLELMPVDRFYLGKTPVTRGQWRAVMGGEVPEIYPGSDQAPMTDITWVEATNFCARLSARFARDLPPSGPRNFRLPTAAEWQLAYREGHTAPDIPKGQDMDLALRTQMCAVGWFGQDAAGRVVLNDRHRWLNTHGVRAVKLTDVNPVFPPRTVNPDKDRWVRDSAQACVPMPVALKPANAFGLYDLAGNVFEMTAERIDGACPHRFCDTEYGFQLGDRPWDASAECGVQSAERRDRLKGDRPLGLKGDRPLGLKGDRPLGAEGDRPLEKGERWPVLVGQPFTPGLPADELWSSYFQKMPHVGFRIAL